MGCRRISCHHLGPPTKKIASWRIKEILDAYETVQPNLLRHEPGYPSAEYLRSVTCEGYPDYGMQAVGKDKDSEGSELIIQNLKKNDSRPLWVLIWGGPNCLAQALWKINNTCTAEETQQLVSKLRVYAISDQDESGPWIRKNFKDLFYIASPGWHSLGGYHYATWSGISGDNFHGRFGGANFEIVDNPWLDAHIRNKGPLGQQYPAIKYLMEGDTPTFFYLIHNGLGSSENPNWGSWGGRYEFYQPHFERWFLEPETRPLWTDTMDEVIGSDGNWHSSNKATIWRWREAFQNDFESRMDWTIKDYGDANHPPIVNLTCPNVIDAKAGEVVELSVEATDPDGNELTYNWFYYPEAGTYNISTPRTGQPASITDANTPKASYKIPKRERPGTMHFIVEVTDNGLPALTRYQRLIINVTN